MTKRILVYGGKGALGSVCVDTFKAQKWVCNVEVKLSKKFAVTYN